MPKQVVAGSSEFRIFETNEFVDGLAGLPPTEANRIRTKLRLHAYPQLRANPFVGPNIRKLRDYSPETWRYRIGRFRAFYLVDRDQRIVAMISIDLRRDAYR